MDVNERTREIMNIFVKLKDMNLGITEFEEFREFRGICNEFIRNGNRVKGEIPIAGTKRIICYHFHNRVDCILKYEPNV